jgi:hypothetical protein
MLTIHFVNLVIASQCLIFGTRVMSEVEYALRKEQGVCSNDRYFEQIWLSMLELLQESLQLKCQQEQLLFVVYALS